MVPRPLRLHDSDGGKTVTLPRRDANAPGDLEFSPGRTFGGYRLVRCLGSGGFAEVWEAEKLLDGRRVALKLLRTPNGLSEEAQLRFEREGRLAASLNHPRTVYVFTAEIIEDHLTIAMEIMHGGSLQDRLDMEGPLRAHQAVDAILDVIDGLEAAQRLGIVHRDVKPSNCFADDSSRVKIGDFGISRSVHADLPLTATGDFVGTPAFASPEQLLGRPMDHRSDMYSVGATLYALLSGRAPFDAAGAGEYMARALTERPVPLSQRGIRVPQTLEAIVLRLLSRDPSRRYASYEALRSALLPFSSRDALAADPIRRFGAYLVDALLWNAIASVALFGLYGGNALEWIQRSTAMPPLATAGWFSVQVLVFALLEWVWQRTPGKYVFRLYVRSLEGPSVSLAQAVLRNLSFWTLHDALGWGALLAPSWLPLFALVGAAIPCLSMRKGNGYAGLHELLSRTRVKAIQEAPQELERPAHSAAALAGPVAGRDGAEYRGPYRVVHEVWRVGDASLTLAMDDLLRRPVWIHESSTPSRTAAPSDMSHRSARLRWLQGGRHEARHWDAYEAPSGMLLAELVEAKRPLDWSEARGILRQLVREIAAALAAEDLPGPLTLENLWVDAFGHLKLLEFPAAAHEDEGREAGSPRDWSDLLRKTVMLVLEGSDPVGAGALPAFRVPVPERARAVLVRLVAAPPDASRLPELIEELDEFCARPASISRLVRSTHLLFAWGVPGVIAIGAFVGVLESLHRPVGGITEGALVLAGGLDAALATIGLISVFALLLTFAFRGGPALRSFGTVVRERDGAPASRARCLLRGAIALLPPLLVSAPIWLVAFIMISGAGPHLENPPPGMSPINDWVWRVGSVLAARARTLPESLRIGGMMTGSVLALVFLAGMVVTVLRPDRGIQDRIAGTRLVPR